ncbi:MAG: hypothetical protein ABI629_01225 [bacterium]
MPAGASQAFALIRVPRGNPRPSDGELREALTEDRQRIGHAAQSAPTDLAVAGPYKILIDGSELDEYVVWER